MKNILVGQSGGPTAVINASLYGVIEEAKADKDLAYNRVITVVSAIYNAGFFDVTLITDLKKM